MYLRSIEFDLPGRDAAVAFLREPWGLLDAGSRGATTYLRGTTGRAYLVSVREAPVKALASITFGGSRAEVDAVWQRVQQSSLQHSTWVDAYDEPGCGAGFTVTGPEGEPYRFVTEQDATAELPVEAARPMQLTHVTLNLNDRDAAGRVLTGVFGFKLSDRTRGLTFVRCDDAHHCLAFANSKQRSLNHAAFEMVNADAVMRGMGRLKDVGCSTAWGPGRHGPGNNVFSYFVAPFGACIEYTSEVQRVGDDYRVGTPEDWGWPPGRTDHWGIATRDDARLIESSEAFPFKAAA